MFSVLFCFEKISWNKAKPNDVSETFRIYVPTLASRKGGWCGFRLTFPVRVTHPETQGFFPPCFFLVKQRMPCARVVSIFHIFASDALRELRKQPNPPVVQTRDPRTFPRFVQPVSEGSNKKSLI